MNWLLPLLDNRFTLFFSSLCLFLFGNLILPDNLFEQYFEPTFLIINILAGILLIHRSHRILKIFIAILGVFILSYMLGTLMVDAKQIFKYIRFAILFLFYGLVTIELIWEVWQSQKVDREVILGLISGYISLGLLGYFMFLSIEIIQPGSFSGLVASLSSPEDPMRNLLYFSFITLMTIGYGDISPVSELSRNGAVLMGLVGQFYLVIITAIVVGKFLNQKSSPDLE